MDHGQYRTSYYGSSRQLRDGDYISLSNYFHISILTHYEPLHKLARINQYSQHKIIDLLPSVISGEHSRSKIKILIPLTFHSFHRLTKVGDEGTTGNTTRHHRHHQVLAQLPQHPVHHHHASGTA
jgi:hypothetical protein